MVGLIKACVLTIFVLSMMTLFYKILYAMTFGERLKQVRIKNGLSQTDLGKLAGVHYTQIGRYESKGAQPSAEVLSKIANALGTSSDFLMSGSTNEQASNTLEDKDLLQQFKKVEQLPSDKKNIVKELLDAFLLKCDVQKKYAS